MDSIDYLKNGSDVLGDVVLVFLEGLLPCGRNADGIPYGFPGRSVSLKAIGRTYCLLAVLVEWNYGIAG